ncbi:MAG: PhnD/SsuA/transferrin family substrate-binding protein [Microbacterium sp.]|uniref:ABC transporter substrate-binding protein n=1 Tax=Microbacterium sp. TaxID=51671 RepID=UPI0039E6CF28
MPITALRARIGITAAVTAFAVAALAGCSASPTSSSTESDGSIDLSGVTLNIGLIDAVTQQLFTDSGLFDDVPYTLNASVGTFPDLAAGLNSGQFDVAFYGVTTPVNQAGNDPTSWTAENAPIKLIGGWSPDQTGEYPWFGVAVSTASGIDSIEDIEGHSIASSTSGDAYPSYLALLDQAGLTEDDITDYAFSTTPEQVSAFATGQADVFVGSFASIATQIESGDAKILITSRELGVPVLKGIAVKTTTLDDAAKVAAIEDWYGRYNELLTTYWDSHEEQIEGLYESLSQQTPELAAYNWNSVKGSHARTFDDVLYDGVQYNADLFYQFGAAKYEVSDVSVFFDDRFEQTIETEEQPQP